MAMQRSIVMTGIMLLLGLLLLANCNVASKSLSFTAGIAKQA